MKVIILAGGKGSRLSEETKVTPKPLVKIGNKPILMHLIEIFVKYEHTEFIICCGYLGEQIKLYFSNLANSKINENKFFIEVLGRKCDVLCLDTGKETQTGGRLLRCEPFVDKNENFFFTYADSLGNIDLNKLKKFHFKHKKLVTVTAVNPPGRFGALKINEGQVLEFNEKPEVGNTWINGGYFLINQKIFDYINSDSDIFEKNNLPKLVNENQLMAYQHYDFWFPMDTLREKEILTEIYLSGHAKWVY